MATADNRVNTSSGVIMINTSEKTSKTQNRLGNRGLIVFLIFLCAFVPLSTDLYLPALPTMTKYFGVSALATNLTLILFFVFFSISTLLWGPLSDKYGRKPILLTGLIAYTIASVLCALSASIYQLIAFRILQALGAGVATTSATAIAKDVYSGKKLESVLAIVQSMVILSPAVAPVIGAALLSLTSWRGIFHFQVALGVIVVIGSLLYSETIKSKNNENILHAISRLGVVLKNPGFTYSLIIFSLLGATFLAFLSSSSYIYQDFFGQSSRVYSYFFAFNAFGMMIGPLLYVKLSSRFDRFNLLTANFVVIIISGLLVIFFGRLSPWAFALTILPSTMMGCFIRPPSTYLMLSMHKENNGSVSSLISSMTTIMGSLGMMAASIYKGDLILFLGEINLGLGLICGTAWLILLKSSLLKASRNL